VRRGDQQPIRVGRAPHGLAVGAGAAWVAGTFDGSITRIDGRTLHTKAIQLDVTPERGAVGAGSVWVTARAAATLIRIDPRRLSVSGATHTGREPFAIGVYGRRAVWLGLVGANAIQRVRLGGR
jgi:streptogramin lyase